MKNIIVGFAFLGTLMTISSAAFVVPEGTQALITQFGQVKGAAITTAGLKFKIPFIQEVRYFDKRILSWDGDADRIPTKDKKYIWVDTTARWRIVDALKFTRSLRSELGARESIDDTLDGITRDIISNFNLVETVRNSNSILEIIEERRRNQKKRAKETEKKARLGASRNSEGETPIKNAVLPAEEEITGEIRRIKTGREKITALITARAKSELASFGIDLIDVQLRSIAYDESVQKKVYQRMISERKRIAERIRSFGQGEYQKIQGKLDQDLKEIQSEAYRTSQEIKGRAEAEAIQIYADSFGSDPGFYEFSKNLEVYRETLTKKGEFILSTDSKFLKLLGNGR